MFGMGAAVSDEERLEGAETRAVLRRAAQMAAPFRRTMMAALVFIAISTAATVGGPLLVRYGIDSGIREGDASALDLAVVLYVVVALVAYVGGRQQHVFVNRAGEGFLRILRIRVFDHIQRQSLAFFDRNKSGVLVSRMTADIESLAELVQWGVLQFVAAAILLTFSLVVLFALSWQLTLVALLVLPIIIVASIKFQRDSNAAYLEVRERVGQNLSALQEGISGVRVIQAYAREPEQRRRFRTSNRALEAKDSLGNMIAGGIFVHLTLHVGMNLLMVVGLAPVVGIPLPWMSYGGSAILVNCMAIGIVLSIRLRRRMF
jgi:ATP-binding cassette subfamily B protein